MASVEDDRVDGAVELALAAAAEPVPLLVGFAGCREDAAGEAAQHGPKSAHDRLACSRDNGSQGESPGDPFGGSLNAHDDPWPATVWARRLLSDGLRRRGLLRRFEPAADDQVGGEAYEDVFVGEVFMTANDDERGWVVAEAGVLREA